MLHAIKTHPVITAVLVGSTGAGGALGLLYGPEDWSDSRNIAAGVVAGIGCAAIVVASRMVGAFGQDIEDDGH
ncbi:MAG: hypothetical protein JRH11_15630 [Deltaproteobacteria bacterium]|nr:hypothetical protein [Deltaproteobacteria bacterium]